MNSYINFNKKTITLIKVKKKEKERKNERKGGKKSQKKMANMDNYLIIYVRTDELNCRLCR